MPRQYSSPLRAEQANQTRLAIIEAAFKLFLENGYSETSIRAIAREAGVSERTIYATFKEKSSILNAIAAHAYYGGSELDEAEEEFRRSLAAVADPRERLGMIAHRVAMGLETGLARLARMVRLAAESDARLYRLVEEMIEARHRSVRAYVEAALGRKLSKDEAGDEMIDELEAITGEEAYWVLVIERGWPRERYERYFVELCLATLRRHGLDIP